MLFDFNFLNVVWHLYNQKVKHNIVLELREHMLSSCTLLGIKCLIAFTVLYNRTVLLLTLTSSLKFNVEVKFLFIFLSIEDTAIILCVVAFTLLVCR